MKGKAAIILSIVAILGVSVYAGSPAGVRRKSASGVGGGAAGAAGPAGAAGSAVYAQTSVGGASTTISDLAIITQANGPLVELKGSSFTVNLSSVSLSPSTETVSGLKTFTSQLTMLNTYFLMNPNSDTNYLGFDLDAVSIGPGLGRIGTSAGSGGGKLRFYSGTLVTDIGYDSTANPVREFYISPYGSTKAFVVTLNGLVGISTSNPTASLQVSSANGTTGNILLISTGNTNLLTINGTSILMNTVPVSISSLTVAPIIMAAHLAATNSPADTQVLKYDAATGKGTWSADNNSGSGSGDNLGTHVATKPINASDFAVLNASTVVVGSTSNPFALLQVSTSNGYTKSLVAVTTGSMKIFEIFGTSVVAYVPIISRYGIEYATSNGGGGGSTTDNGFTAFLTTGQAQISAAAGFNLAQSTINSKLDNLIAGASFYIQNGTTPVNRGGVIVASSATFTSTVTVIGGMIIGGNGAAGISPQVGTVLNIYGDMAFPTTWYTGVRYPTFCGTSTMTIVNVSTPSNGLAWMDGLAIGSGTFAPGFYAKKIPKTFIPGTSFVAGANVNPTTPTITDFTDYSSGTVTQNRAYLVSFATAADATQTQNLVYTSTVVYVASGNVGVNGGFVTTKTIVPLNGLINLLGSGGCVLWIRVARDGNSAADAASSFSAPADIGLTFKVQQ